jgi:hypothetical protein
MYKSNASLSVVILFLTFSDSSILGSLRQAKLIIISRRTSADLSKFNLIVLWKPGITAYADK